MSDESGPAEVSEVERLREQVRRLEEREAGFAALVRSYGERIERLSAELDGELMGAAAMAVQAGRDRQTIDRIRRAAADADAAADREILRMRAVVQQSNAAVERLQAESRRLQVGAVVESAKQPPGGTSWRGVVVHIDEGKPRNVSSVLVWWWHPGLDLAGPQAPEWSTRDGLTVVVG